MFPADAKTPMPKPEILQFFTVAFAAVMETALVLAVLFPMILRLAQSRVMFVAVNW